MYDGAAQSESSALERRASVHDHGLAMPRRKQFAEREHLEQAEAHAPAPQPEDAKESEQGDEGRNAPESILRLQEAIGNRALSRALRDRFALGAAEAQAPGAQEAGLPGMLQQGLRGGVEELMGKSPADQVSLLAAMAHTLPPESQELLRSAGDAVSQSPGGGGKMNAQLLKSLARARLGRLPPESAITDPSALVDRLCDGVAFGWQQWQTLAMFTNVIVQGPMAIMGQIQAPPLSPFVLAFTGSATGPEAEAAQAVAGALDDGMRQWQAQPKFPGLPLYPSFAAMPVPHTAPTPNIPVPVAALVGGAVPPPMSAAGRAADPGAAAIAEAVLGAITGGAFQMWASTTMVVNLLGHGPVPTYAPPYVPVGPVVGGTVLPMPGVLQ
jgi:hypothetical protein